MEHLNESATRVSISSNISRPAISCESLNSNYIVSSKSFTKYEVISTKNLSITDVTKNSVTSKHLNNSKSLLSDQKNLGSNLHKVRIENPSRIIFGQMNINSIRNKFDLLMNIIKNEIDILMISETKIDNSFPISQFTMTGYSIPFRLDRTRHGGGILLFFREDIPSKIIKTDCDPDFEEIFVEINLRKKKWLLCCSYNPHKRNITNHLKNICKTLDKLNSTYDNLVLLGDFNTEPEERSISEFLNLYNLKNLVKQSTCFRNPNKPTRIDLILTNCPRSFQNTDTFETGLSAFHKLTFTVLKQHFPKQKPKVVIH